MSEHKKTIAIFVGSPRLEISPSLLNLVGFLGDHYRVHLFSKLPIGKHLPVLSNRNIAIFRLTGRIGYYSSLLVARSFYRLGLYHFTLSVDPRAFFVLKQILPGARPFYYSLELYKDADPHSRLSPEIAERENSEIHSIRGLIIQSPEREQVFRESYNLSVKIPTLILPVTYTGPAVLERKDDLRARYGLPATCRIALHVGGIAWYSWCIELARAFADIPNWCLIFHGYVQSDYLAELSSVIRAEKIKNVLISNTYSQTFEGMYSFLQSGDVGVAWYEDISPNMRTSAKSSGKISAYLKFGLPVITKRYPSAIDAIERPRCGICIDDLSFLQGALDQIVRDYSSYSKNAWLEYERVYRFENYHSQIHDFLEANA